MAIINGKRLNVPESGIYGSEIINQAGIMPGRRAVIKNGGTQFEAVQPHKYYSKSELIDKWGNSVKVTSIPRRIKGVTYGAPRSHLSKTIIAEQVIDIAQNYLKNGLDFDENNTDWLIAPKFKLPHPWDRTSPLLIIFPTEYPSIPPIGFYLKEDIGVAPDGHLFSAAFHDACQDPIANGWKWYCVYVDPGCWSPAAYRYPGDWKKGDSLWTYFTLINEVLASKGG